MNENIGFDSEKTVIGSVPGSDATQMIGSNPNATSYAASIECPVCHTPNPPSERYCSDCGFMLGSAPVAAEDMPSPVSYGKIVATNGSLEFSLNMGLNSVGREGADVLLTNNTVSRKHANIHVEGKGVFVEDLGSTNGTFVDGAKIQQGMRAELNDGCDVTFGSVTLKYEAPEIVEKPEESTSVAEPQEFSDSVEVTQMSAPLEASPEIETDSAEFEQIAAEPAEDQAEDAAQAGPVVKLCAKDGGQGFELAVGANTIGRREGANSVVISDPYCSGRHADLTVQDGIFVLTDVGSTNGTLVNGVRLEPNVPRELRSGDEITFGRPVFRLEVENGELS